MTETQLEVYGTVDDLREMGSRIKAFQAGKEIKLTELEAQQAAQYAMSVDANPWRGEIYAYKDKRGKLHIVEGYKLLVRWARKQCPYSESYTMLTDEEKPPGSVGWRCWILREDSGKMLKMLRSSGISSKEAFEIVATDAVGVVTQAGMGRKQPPTGWTWDQVAKKRALKNALNKSHGAPSPRDLARQSWEVGTTQTEAGDWVQVEKLPQDVMERAAAASAQARERVYAEHERDTAMLAEPATRGRSKLFHDTPAREAAPEIIDQNIDGAEIETLDDGGPPWPEELAPEQPAEPPTDEPEEQAPADDALPEHWTHFSNKVMEKLGYPKRSDIIETLKANGFKEICKSDGICAFDRAKGWDVLVQAMGG